MFVRDTLCVHASNVMMLLSGMQWVSYKCMLAFAMVPATERIQQFPMLHRKLTTS